MSTGNFLEDKIIQVNRKFRKQGKAMIEKMPNDFRIVRKNGKIEGAYPRSRGSVDFMGFFYNRAGRPTPIAFECKETENKYEFPLFIRKKPMVKKHQMEFLDEWWESGAEAFYLIYFKQHKELWKVSPFFIYMAYKEAEESGRKSIKRNEFVNSDKCKLVHFNDYLNEVSE